MQVVKYEYAYSTEKHKEYLSIKGINRTDYAVDVFIKYANFDITITKPTAFIYVDGFTVTQSETRTDSRNMFNIDLPINPDNATIKEGSSYAMHKWISTFKGKENIVYATIAANTCASSMYAIYEAERLLQNKICEEVIILGSERVSYSTIKLFKELRIPITCSDGIAYIKLSNDFENLPQIKNSKWLYSWNKNPFIVTKDSINKLLVDNKKYDFIKVHGTGTETNNKAEEICKLYTDNIIKYKSIIGHSQGISGLLEICMLLDDNKVKGKGIAIATGLGGFLGSCTIIK